ncbi:MAG TPA: hypothetical protein VEX39_06625 [Thermoleophilaceae bacterium]|nr:hypothetical protein [Thermoleophilaceae bacterium]
MSEEGLKLHAAIAAVLIDASDARGERAWMTYDEVASKIAALDLYRRGDGKHPPPGQISARVHQYPRVFERRDRRGTEVSVRLAQRR